MSDFQKFSETDLSTLRGELRQAGLDSFQVAELLMGFLAARGYGSSADDARMTATQIEPICNSLPRLQEELERLAWVV